MTARKNLATLAPELNIEHLESLAIMVGSSLAGMPDEFYEDIVAHARAMGAARLAEISVYANR